MSGALYLVTFDRPEEEPARIPREDLGYRQEKSSSFPPFAKGKERGIFNISWTAYDITDDIKGVLTAGYTYLVLNEANVSIKDYR